MFVHSSFPFVGKSSVSAAALFLSFILSYAFLHNNNDGRDKSSSMYKISFGDEFRTMLLSSRSSAHSARHLHSFGKIESRTGRSARGASHVVERRISVRFSRVIFLSLRFASLVFSPFVSEIRLEFQTIVRVRTSFIRNAIERRIACRFTSVRARRSNTFSVRTRQRIRGSSFRIDVRTTFISIERGTSIDAVLVVSASKRISGLETKIFTG